MGITRRAYAGLGLQLADDEARRKRGAGVFVSRLVPGGRRSDHVLHCEDRRPPNYAAARTVAAVGRQRTAQRRALERADRIRRVAAAGRPLGHPGLYHAALDRAAVSTAAARASQSASSAGRRPRHGRNAAADWW